MTTDDCALPPLLYGFTSVQPLGVCVCVFGGGHKAIHGAAVFACAVQRASSSYSLAHTNKDDTDEGSALVSVLVREILPA